MTTEEVEQDKLEAEGAKEITFECRLCGKSQPLDEMVVLTRFFPSIAACRNCEKQMR